MSDRRNKSIIIIDIQSGDKSNPKLKTKFPIYDGLSAYQGYLNVPGNDNATGDDFMKHLKGSGPDKEITGVTAETVELSAPFSFIDNSPTNPYDLNGGFSIDKYFPIVFTNEYIKKLLGTGTYQLIAKTGFGDASAATIKTLDADNPTIRVSMTGGRGITSETPDEKIYETKFIFCLTDDDYGKSRRNVEEDIIFDPVVFYSKSKPNYLIEWIEKPTEIRLNGSYVLKFKIKNASTGVYYYKGVPNNRTFFNIPPCPFPHVFDVPLLDRLEKQIYFNTPRATTTEDKAYFSEGHEIFSVPFAAVNGFKDLEAPWFKDGDVFNFGLTVFLYKKTDDKLSTVGSAAIDNISVTLRKDQFEPTGNYKFIKDDNGFKITDTNDEILGFQYAFISDKDKKETNQYYITEQTTGYLSNVTFKSRLTNLMPEAILTKTFDPEPFYLRINGDFSELFEHGLKMFKLVSYETTFDKSKYNEYNDYSDYAFKFKLVLEVAEGFDIENFSELEDLNLDTTLDGNTLTVIGEKKVDHKVIYRPEYDSIYLYYDGTYILVRPSDTYK